MPRHRLTQTLTTVACLLVALGSAEAQDGVRLRIRTTAGKPVRMRMTMEVKQKFKMGGLEMTTTTQTVTHASLEGDGGLPIRLRFGRTHGTVEIPALGKLAFDSTAALPEESVARAIAFAMSSSAYTEFGLSMDDRGNVSEITGIEAALEAASAPLGEDDLTLYAELVNVLTQDKVSRLVAWHFPVLPLPSADKGKGDSWTSRLVVPGTSSKMVMTIPLRHTIIGVDQQFVTVESRAKIEIKPDPARPNPVATALAGEGLKESSFIGTGKIHRADGLPESFDFEMVIRGEMPPRQPGGPTGTLVQKGTFKLRRIEGDAAASEFRRPVEQGAVVTAVVPVLSAAAFAAKQAEASRHGKAGRIDKAIASYKEAIALIRALEKKHPDNLMWTRSDPILHIVVAKLLDGAGRAPLTVRWRVAAEDLFANMSREALDDDMRTLRAYNLLRLADLSLAADQPDAAWSWASRAAAGIDADTDGHREIRSQAHAALARSFDLSGETDSAVEAIRKAISERDLIRKWDVLCTTRMVAALDLLGKLSMKADHPSQAHSAWSRAAVTSGAEREPGTTGPILLLQKEGAGILAAKTEPATPLDHLGVAYALEAAGRHAAATGHFETAFKDATLKSRTGEPHIYNAACAASLAAAAEEDETAAAKHVRTALDLLITAVAGMRKRIAELTQSADPESVDEDDAAQLGRLTSWLDWARTGDPDLARIRDEPAFNLLFPKPAEDR